MLLDDAVRKLAPVLTVNAVGVPLVSVTVCAAGAAPPATCVNDSEEGAAVMAVGLKTVYRTDTVSAGIPIGVIVMASL